MKIDIVSAELTRLYDDWQERRQGRLYPARRDFAPWDIKYILGRLNLLDVFHRPLRFRWRLHGSEVVRYVGRDMTGKFVHDDPLPEFRSRVYEEYAHAVTERGPVAFTHSALMDGRPYSYEILVLPLSSDGVAIDMLMAGFDFREPGTRR